VALAWLLARDPGVVPIPGTTRRPHLRDNLGALDVTLTAQEVAQLDELRPAGTRYPDMTWVNRDTVPLPGKGDRA
jgi:aryl-alcohol dehydrogenase-like predicted oxidoreductase